MKPHEDQYRFNHMLAYAREALGMIKEKDRTDLSRDRMLELALVRLIEVIGEAASKVSQQGKTRFPLIPWREVMNMRNRLIHGYDNVDLNVLWDTVETDLPELIKRLEDVFSEK